MMLKMFPRIAKFYHIDEYRLRLEFTNGESAELDLASRIVGRGGIFKDFENIDFFKSVKVDPDFGILVWPNDVDFCPDVLYSEALGKDL